MAARIDPIAEPRGTRTPFTRNEYSTLAVVAHGGLGTIYVDGNTRLCTATAAASLTASFRCDGQPGSCTDVDHADVIALWGHHVAETQIVLWSSSPEEAR